ncbi:DUF4349 domain-containing protein [Beutenbergia cavernae]|nr:DUF4349 domain-containing protein [Beutenbergia cavernae]
MTQGHRVVRGVGGAVVAIFLGAILLVGCSGGGGSSGDDGIEGADGGGDMGANEGAGAEEAAADREAPAQDTDGEVRQVITTAMASVLVEDPAAAADELADTAEGAGGRVERRSEQAGDDVAAVSPSASVTVRVPSDDLTTVIDSLDDLGEVRDLNQESTDVTEAAQDLDARIAALETSTDRLLEIMAGAEDSSDLLAAESALSERQAELESLQSERDYLADQVAMSTLDVTFVAESEPTIEPSGFTGGIANGWRALVSFVGVVLAVTGALLPWLLVIGVPAALVTWVVRRRRGRVAVAPGGSSVVPKDDGGA